MPRRFQHGFTLVEMLVVIGIIAVLAALLVPTVNVVLKNARNAALGVEINQLATAVETYKQERGDYPPNFRDQNVLLRHIRKCYPKADATYIANFVARACNRPAVGSTAPNYFIDEGESLVFWLSMTDNDPRYPFLSYFNPAGVPIAPKKYYDFDETRLAEVNPLEVNTTTGQLTADVRSYKAKFCKDTYYIYVDSRAYLDTCRIRNYGNPQDAGDDFAYAEDITDTTNIVRSYWSDIASTTGGTTQRDRFKPMNATTFQIISAGQDGEFSAGAADVMGYPSGLNYSDADKDNITNFSAGKTLADNIP